MVSRHPGSISQPCRAANCRVVQQLCALAAHGPDGVGHLCLVCEPEMEISGSPVMAMCTRGIADENLLLVLVKSQKHLRKIWHAALEFA